MSETVCFRCDWHGRAHRPTCPACGAPLHRPEPPPGRRPAADTRQDAAPEPAGRERPTVPGGIALAIAVALAITAVVAIERIPGARPTPPRSSSIDDPVGSGALVFLADGGEGRATLWLLDLLDGVVRPGPAVPRATAELVDLSRANPGWIGIERAADRRSVAAAIVRGLFPHAEVDRLGSGDLVAWGPRGESLVFARNGRTGATGCAPVRISLVSVITREEAWALKDPGFCGPILSLSRSTAATYFTAASGDRLSVYLTGSVGVPHLMFDGVGVLSASPPAAFLLRPDASERTRSGVSREASTMLGWKGIGGPITVGDGEDVLSVERILAWSADGSRVAMVGSLGPRTGVFVVAAGSGTGPRVPRYVMPSGRTIDATFDASGRLYLAVDGEVFVTRDDEPTRLALPEGTPPPTGPIVWIP